MNDIVGMALSNAAAATLLALIVAAITHFARRPQVMHALWLLVLVKLITPPLVSLPLLAARVTESEPASAAVVPSALTSVSFDTPRSAPVGAPRAPAPEGHDEAPRQMIVPQLFTFLPTAAELLLCLWALGSLALVSLSVTRILRFDRRVWTLPRADESL